MVGSLLWYTIDSKEITEKLAHSGGILQESIEVVTSTQCVMVRHWVVMRLIYYHACLLAALIDVETSHPCQLFARLFGIECDCSLPIK